MRHAVISSVEKLSRRYLLARLKLLENLPSEPLPTQFVMLWVPRIDYLPMSVAWYTSEELHIFFSIRGEGTEALSKHEGVVGVVGPLGRGLRPEECGSRCLIAAGGTGLASVIRLAEGLRRAGAE
ncbi:MAG: dihydroorotate dehydrogenase, partial [Desulfurococcales archaeon]|nr:dihydroorotate dehydrogenase [Desulfurococcales archaeon]